MSAAQPGGLAAQRRAPAAERAASARPWSGRTIHFVGVAGAGMSGYARAAAALGAQVSGSDRRASPYSERLATDGVLQARIGEHDAANLPGGENVELVYSSAVLEDNPERAAARARGLPERSRAQLLAELTGLRRTIAVAGTHGKTTTASMLVYALCGAGTHPDWLIGGAVGPGLANAHWSGEGEWLVVEADESDRSMLELSFEIAVLTNVELDHHATFGTLAQVREAFRQLLARAGRAIVVWERPELLELAPGAAELVAYGTPEPERATVDRAGRSGTGGGGDAGARGVAEVSRPGDEGAGADGPRIEQRFEWHGHEVRLAVPGEHNALNARAALEAAMLAGAAAEGAIAGLARFRGAERRFQPLGTSASGARVYDDYAHHPSEVAATLMAARTLAPKRLVAVFQPHLYSRTRMFARELGAALIDNADVAVVLDVYPARERGREHPGVGGLLVAEAAAEAGAGRAVYWLPTFADAEPAVRALLRQGDLCVVMGAGDVDELARALVRA
jgi:UDP-N-acetylmuramate--alanine ligase